MTKHANEGSDATATSQRESCSSCLTNRSLSLSNLENVNSPDGVDATAMEHDGSGLPVAGRESETFPRNEQQEVEKSPTVKQDTPPKSIKFRNEDSSDSTDIESQFSASQRSSASLSSQRSSWSHKSGSLRKTFKRSMSIMTERLVLRNRLRRKAKSIFHSGIVFCGAIVTLLLDIGGQDDSYASRNSRVGILGAAVMAYVIGTSVAILFHAQWIPRRIETNRAIEEAYERTSAWPVIDSLLEIPLSFKYGVDPSSPPSFFATLPIVLAWTIYCATLLNGIFLMVVAHRHGLLEVPLAASDIVAAIEFYFFTGGICEYWVHTRPHNMLPE